MEKKKWKINNFVSFILSMNHTHVDTWAHYKFYTILVYARETWEKRKNIKVNSYHSIAIWHTRIVGMATSHTHTRTIN